MRLGIFAKTIRRQTPAATLEAISKYGLREVHWNMACVGLDTLPAELNANQCRRIRDTFTRYRMGMCGISATFNAIDPDRTRRTELTRRACLLIQHCKELGTEVVTLCTGTRNSLDMWTDHPANREHAAWDDLCATLNELLSSAQRHNVFLGVEPEQSNVIHSAAAARRLLDEFGSPHLRIVLDAANLLHPGNLAKAQYVLDEAIELLSGDIIMAHAKDVPRNPGQSSAVGQGVLDWEHYLRSLVSVGFHGALVLHNLTETEVPDSMFFLTGLLGRIKYCHGETY